MADMTVANTILEQYGGKQFIAMTGASNFVGTENSLTCRIAPAKNLITHVVTTLMPSDTYKVEFLHRNIACGIEISREVVSIHEDVYFDSLQDLFEEETDIYATLTSRR